MWSDDLDKKLQDASGEHVPPFDEKAWGKMEVLLDKHLPQKKKRRGLIFLLAFLAVGGTAAFFIYQNSKTAGSGKPAKEIVQETPGTATASPIKGTSGDDASTQETITKETAGNQPAEQASAARIKDNTSTDPTIGQITTTSSSSPKAVDLLPGSKTNTNARKQAPATDIFDVPGNSGSKTGRKQASKKISSYPSNPGQQPGEATDVSRPEPGTQQEPKPVDPVVTTAPAIDGDGSVKQTDSARKEIAPEVIAPEPAKKKDPSRQAPGSKFSLQFSFGPDVSSVGANNMGRLKMQVGLGAAYALSKRLTLRTGFYVSRKIYSADSNQYHPPKGFWNYYPNLDKVDANCLVYEIPVSIAYNFATGKRSNWFASAGLSSYIMKKEEYGISYKDVWGSNQYHSIDMNNENRHFFSVVNLSAGYQYNLTERLSLAAEPYVKIPVSGVGFGKVKLNSGGVLFTVGFKPFLKKK
ncbi:MAG TPA: hypothetical protein VK644_11775 [Chitinophagaceae bacterium]|nr:hypothetical protein [Chitinophagaceae bacterium]